MTINIAETIRKIMGWCPYAGAFEVRKTVQFDDTVINKSNSGKEPDSGKGSNLTTASWWNRYRNRKMLYSILLTLPAIAWFIDEEGISNTEFFLAGIFAGILLWAAAWSSGWHSIDEMVLHGSIKVTWKEVVALLIIILFSFIFLIYFNYILHAAGKTGAFTSGLFLTGWIDYFQIVYWERKNCKIIIVHRFQKPAIEALDAGSRV